MKETTVKQRNKKNKSTRESTLKELKREVKGITLIALAVTIIVLLILAGITISLTMGENGVISRAIFARDKTIIADEIEAIQLAYSACKLDDYSSIVSAGDMQEELEKSKNNIQVSTLEDNLIVWFKETNHRYKVNQNGEVEQISDLTEEDAKKVVDAGILNGMIYVETADGTVGLSNESLDTNSELVKLDNATIKSVTNSGIKNIFGNGFIDNENKIYTWVDEINSSNFLPICLTDTEGNALYNKKIEKVFDGNAVFVIDNEGKVYSFGNNGNGILGDGTRENSYLPICITDIENSELKNKFITNIYISYHNILALDKDGKVYSWGSNFSGSLGDGTNSDRYIPKCISDIPESALNNKVIKDIYIDSYWGNAYAIDEDGKLYTWGYNKQGQVGDGTLENKYLPVCINDTLDELKDRKFAYVNNVIDDSIIALDEQGRVYTWGINDEGQLGDGTFINRQYPLCISEISGSVLNNVKIKDISGYDIGSIYAISEDGKLYSWGRNDTGQVGDGTMQNRNIPICISDIETSALKNKIVTDFYNQDSTIMVLDSEKNLYMWGYDASGRVADGKLENVSSPICVTQLNDSPLYNKKIKQIESSSFEAYSVIALDDENNVYFWGDNENGQAGSGIDKADILTPICLNNVQESPLYNQKIIKIRNGGDDVMYVLENGDVMHAGFHIIPR